MNWFYIASRTKHAAKWRDLRDKGVPIISSWLDESEPGQTASFTDLWKRIEDEIRASSALLIYMQEDDFPLRGALVETGMALAHGKPVFACLQRVTLEGPIGSWLAHPNVYTYYDFDVALRALRSYVQGRWLDWE